MSRYLGSTVSLAALAAVLATAAPASAQLADLELEGPITSITLGSEPIPPAIGAPAGVTSVGTMKVMGVDVKVRSDARIHTPTNDDLSLDNGVRDPAAGLSKLATGPMPGRAEQGFIGGTGIIIGDSLNGTFYARDVFSDLFENVVVGEATASDPVTGRITVQGMELIKSKDPRMPAGKPINGYGFEMKPSSVVPGTLLAAEGYYSKGKDALYYHTIEADSATLVNSTSTEVSIMRADCRIRGGGQDEVSVRGGVHHPANGQVVIQMPNLNTPDPVDWINIATAPRAVADTTVTPAQGIYNFDRRNLNLGGSCPGILRAQYTGTTGVAYATFVPDSR